MKVLATYGHSPGRPAGETLIITWTHIFHVSKKNPKRNEIETKANKYLLKDALQITALVLPELDLHEGRGVVTVQQGLRGVSLQNVPQLPHPLDHHRLDGVD